MERDDVQRLMDRGLRALDGGDTLSALAFLERASTWSNSPELLSSLGYCMARERGQVVRGMEMCLEAINRDPDSAMHYHRLGRIQLLAGLHQEALASFRQGVGCADNGAVLEELLRFEVRKTPPLPFLRRDNPLNKYLGIMLRRLGLR